MGRGLWEPYHGLLTIKYLMARAKKQDGVQLEYRDSYKGKMTSVKEEEEKEWQK